MHLLIPRISKQLIMQHHILPRDSLIQLKLYLVDFMFGLHVNEKVCMVENCVDQQIGRVLGVVDLAC